MKKLFKVLGWIIVLIVMLLVALQIFLNRGLNPVVQKALPQVSESIGVDVAIESVAINLMGGSLNIKNAKVANPQGFKENNVFALGSVALDVHLRALMNGIVQVSKASVENAKITIVRNDMGDVNLTKIQEQLPEANKPEETANHSIKEEPKKEKTESVNIPKIQIDQLAFNTTFEFVDYKTTNATPHRLGLNLSIEAADVVTFGTLPESEWGTILIKGGLREHPERFATEIKARIAPITDSQGMSFTAEGAIASIDMQDLGKEVSDEIGISSQSVDITMKLIVRNGAFMDGSKLVATVRDAALAGKLKKKHKKTKLPPDLSITIPVSGTMAKPSINIVQAITTSILQNITKNPDYLLDNVTVDGKSLRERLNKVLGGDRE